MKQAYAIYYLCLFILLVTVIQTSSIYRGLILDGPVLDSLCLVWRVAEHAVFLSSHHHRHSGGGTQEACSCRCRSKAVSEVDMSIYPTAVPGRTVPLHQPKAERTQSSQDSERQRETQRHTHTDRD